MPFFPAHMFIYFNFVASQPGQLTPKPILDPLSQRKLHNPTITQLKTDDNYKASERRFSSVLQNSPIQDSNVYSVVICYNYNSFPCPIFISSSRVTYKQRNQ